MKTIDLKAGDRIHYKDRDDNSWGPWKVVAVEDGSVTVQVDGLITCSFDFASLNLAPAVPAG